MPLKKLSYLVSVWVATTALTGCFSDEEVDPFAQSTLRFSFGMENSKEIANNSNIPLPNNLYFFDAAGALQPNLVIMGCGATNTGLETAVENATKCSLEDLDGWSTTAPFSLPISGDLSLIDDNSFARGVLLTADGQPLTYGQDFTVGTTAFGHLQILPLNVLRPKTTYQLVVTQDLTDRSGHPVAPSLAYLARKQKDDAYGQHINATETLAAAELGIGRADIVYAAQFTTQSIGGELLALNSDARGIQFDSATVKRYKVDSFIPGCRQGQQCVEKLSGTVELPNYLPASGDISQNCTADDANQQEAEFWYQLYGANTHTDSFRYTRESCPGLYQPMDFADPSVTTVEVSMVLPPQEAEGTQFLDVLIAAHGITTAKEMGNGGMLVFDNYLQPKVAGGAKASGADGYATIAIDHVYHGTRSISFDGSAGYDCDGDEVADTGCFQSSEESKELKGQYDISVSSSLRGLFAEHGLADPKNFLKADALLTSRDHFRKVVADLLNLKAAVANAADVSGRVLLNDQKVSIYGHSMGSIAAATASGIEQIKGQPFAGTILANTGGGVGGIIMNSIWLGRDEVPPAVKFLPEYRLRMAAELGIKAENEAATLAAVRQFAETDPEVFLAKSHEVAPQFLAEMQYLIQAVVDTVDPLNYADKLQGQPMLSMTTVGNIDHKPDRVDYQGAGFTAADQTVPIRIELGAGTTFTRCAPVADLEAGSVSNNLTCASGGIEQAPYYSLDLTEFPLSGAEALERVLNLKDVREGTQRSATRLTEGNHNIGAGHMTDSVSEGTKDGAKVKQAAMEIGDQTVDFLSDVFGVVSKPDTTLLPMNELF